MSVSTAPRDTQRKGDEAIPPLDAFPMIAGAIGYVNCMAGTDAAGRVGLATSTSIRIVGVFDDTFDNSSGGAGALIARVRYGKYKFTNAAASGHTITQADLPCIVYAADDNTLSKNSADGPKAGVATIVDPDGVWAYITPLTLLAG